MNLLLVTSGRYGDSRGPAGPVLHAALRPLVWLIFFRQSAAMRV